MQKFTFTIIFIGLFLFPLTAQEAVFGTFKDRWVINTHSVETLPKRKLDIRITHRFGDLAGDGGGWTTFYGLENVADVLIGAEYGLTDDVSVGWFRTKGAGDLNQLLHWSGKYRALQQGKNGMPISLTGVGMLTLSTQQKSDAPAAPNNFDKFSHRIIYNLQALAARQFSETLALQFSTGFTHRNLTQFGQENNIFNVGLAGRVQITKIFGLIADFVLPLNGIQSPFSNDAGADIYSPGLGIGLEIETGGHVFQINFTNARAIMPTDYIPYTRSAKWGDGQFRLGFTISRMFNL